MLNRLLFSPCTYDFSLYDNSTKKAIVLGGNSCYLSITPTTNSLELKATENIHLMPGINIFPATDRFVSLKIVECD